MVDNQQGIEKPKDENAEDLSVIAQRFLNIFRQLHVFTPERKQSFNEAIIALPSEIRGSFSKLLGGGALQEYVDELEKKTGNVSTRDGVSYSHNSTKATTGSPQTTSVDKVTEQLLAKVLESSQKNAQDAAQAQIQFQAKFLETMKNMPQTSSAGTALDNSKLEEIVNNIVKSQLASVNSIVAQAGVPAIDNFKLEETISSIVKSQLASSGSLSTTSAVSDGEHIESIISKIVKTQANLIADATRIQTEQLSKTISASLKESYNYSTQSIIETLRIMNRDSVDTLRESFRLYSSNQPPIMVSNYNVSGANPHGASREPSHQITQNNVKEIVYDKAPTDFYYETNEQKNVPPINTANIDRNHQSAISEQDDFDRSEKKKKKKNKNKNRDINNNNVHSSFSPQVEERNIDDFDKISLPEDGDLSLDDISFASSEIVETIENEDDGDWNWIDSPKSDTFETPHFENFEELPDNSQNKELQEVELGAIEEDFIEAYSEDSIVQSEEEALEETEQDAEIEEYAEEEQIYPKSEVLLAALQTKNGFSFTDERSNTDNHKIESAIGPIAETTPTTPVVEASNEEEWEYVEEETSSTESAIEPIAETTPTTPVMEASNEEEWEYVEEETSSTESAIEEEEEWEWVEEDSEDEDGEWEYVEEETSSSEPATEEEEWEWVEEDSEDEDGEWEWEYEEVPDDEKTLVDQEPITFEEEYIEPEGEYTKKLSPISSGGILEQESIFNFNPSTAKTDIIEQTNESAQDDNLIHIEELPVFEEVTSELTGETIVEESEISLIDEIPLDLTENSFEFSEETSSTDEPINFEMEELGFYDKNMPELEDYLNLEEIDNEDLLNIKIGDGYEALGILTDEGDKIIEDLETIDIDSIDINNIKTDN